MVWRDKENAQESTMGLKKIMAFPRPISKSIIIGKIIFLFYFFKKIILDLFKIFKENSESATQGQNRNT